MRNAKGRQPAVNEKEFATYLDSWIPAHKQEIIGCLLRMLRIPSVGTDPVDGKPFGVEVDRAYQFYLDEAQKAGMSTKNVDGYAVHAEIGSGKEMAMALTHVDIVPVGSGWSKDPYGEVVGGYVYGRGSQDNKGPTVACLYALRALNEGCAPLKRRARHVVGGNEESGFRCVRHYFEVEEQPAYGFSPDAMFPLVFAEKGSMNAIVAVDLGPGTGESGGAGGAGRPGRASVVRFTGGERANIVADRAEAVLRVPGGQEDWVVSELEEGVEGARFAAGGPGPLTFEFAKGKGTVEVAAKGKSAHASTPHEGTNAVTGLAHLLAGLGDGIETAESLSFIAAAGEIYGKGLDIESRDDVSGRLSCNLGLARTDETGGKRVLRFTYNIRFPVRVSGEEIKERALRCKRPDGVTVEVPNVGKSHYTDPDSHLVKTLLRIYREETGDNSPPIAIGGGTYAKVIDGGVAYGPVRPGVAERAHQADERITVDDLVFLVRVYARALFALAT